MIHEVQDVNQITVVDPPQVDVRVGVWVRLGLMAKHLLEEVGARTQDELKIEQESFRIGRGVVARQDF